MDSSSDLELWQPLPAPSGHFGPVQDLSWEPNGGKFLLSVSSDQTTRLHAPWKQEEGDVSYAPSQCFYEKRASLGQFCTPQCTAYTVL